MTLFTDFENRFQRSRHRRSRLGWGLISVAVLGTAAVALVPAPYVIEKPGPVYNTLGDVSVDDAQVAMIQVPSQTTYPTAGTLDMLTVSVRGNPSDLPNWFEVATAYLNPSQAVIPVDSIYPPGYSVDDSNKQGEIDMQNSQKEAVAAALTDLGYRFESTLTVVQTTKSTPADGVLQTGDIIQTVNGSTFTDVTGLRAEIADNGTGKPAEVEFTRDGQSRTASLTPIMSTGADPSPILGIVVGSDYTFPFSVQIQLENVGGPSAGMMFALGIIDKLTPGELNGGQNVAGTGTIGATGEVGPIGGIRQKMYGARDAGARWFLAPKANCDEVTGHIPGGLTVFAVANLNDSLAALKAIAAGSDTSALPTCPAP